MEYLKSKGVKFGENGMTKTHSKHSGITYHATATKHIKNLLSDFRRKEIIETKTK